MLDRIIKARNTGNVSWTKIGVWGFAAATLVATLTGNTQLMTDGATLADKLIDAVLILSAATAGTGVRDAIPAEVVVAAD